MKFQYMFDNKTVSYLFLRLSSSMNSFRMNKFLMFFNIVKIYQSTQAVLNLAVFQFSFCYTKILQKSGIQKNEVIELIYRGFI
jgi:hypothetical protein